MKIVIELFGEGNPDAPDAADATLRHIAASPDCCLSDGDLAIRAEVVGVVKDVDQSPGATRKLVHVVPLNDLGAS